MTTNRTGENESLIGEYKLPVSVQHFPTMVEENYIYVDKTRYVHNLLQKGRLYFLSRPRRFGKSLLISILEEIFNGKKELFKGYWIYNQQMDWKKYPVIHLDFLGIDYKNLGLEKAIMNKLDRIAKQHSVECEGDSCKEKFGNLIENLSSEKRVVVLIDEYDKPIIDYVESEDMNIAEENRKKLKNFYAVLKSQDGNIKFLFITGVSRFSRVSIFSDLNNLDDITLHPDYSKMFGYTREEIETYFRSYIDKWIEKEGGTNDQLLEHLKDEYNGYSWDGRNFLYNPHSIHKFFDELSFGSCWFETGTPNFLVKVIMEKGLNIENWENMEVRRAFFNEFNIEDININLLLFQTGYLTIKKFDEGQYTLSYPNKEVQSAFLHLLLEKYSLKKHEYVEEITKKIKETLREGNIDSFVDVLKSLFADIPYDIIKNIIKGKEAYYHSIILIVLKISNIAVIAEKETNIGRIDAMAETGKYIYIIEFKMGSADEAMKQILEKKYYEPFLARGKEMILLGIAFGLEEKNISEFEYITFGLMEKINPVRIERSGVIAVLNLLESQQAMSLEINKRKEIERDIESKIKTGKYPVHGHFIEKMEEGYLFFLKNPGEFMEFCIECKEISNKNGVFFQITADSGNFKLIENNGQVKKVLGSKIKLPSRMDRYDDKNTLVVLESFFHSLKEVFIWGNINTELLNTTTGNINIYSLDFTGIVDKVATGMEDGYLLTFDSEGYHPDDKNFNYYCEHTGQTLQGLLGSPNFKHSYKVNCVVVSPDGRTVLSGAGDKTIKWWDLKTGKEIRTFQGHSEEVNSVVFSPDGKTMVSGSHDKTIKWWDLESGKEIKAFKGHKGYVWSVAVSPDGKLVVSGSDDKTLRCWDLESGNEIRILEGHERPIYSVSISPNGKTVVSASYDKTIKLWELESGREIRTFRAHTDSIKNATFSSDGHTLISASWDNTVKYWDLESGKVIKTFRGHKEHVSSVALSPDGKIVVSGSDDKTLKCWDLESGKEIKTFRGHKEYISSVAFSPDGKIVVSGSDDKTLNCWDLESGKEIKSFRGHKGYVWSVAFSPDGKTVVSGSEDKTIKCWDLESGREIKTFRGHKEFVWSVAFSPDGKTVVSGSEDNTLRCWDLESGKEIKAFRGHKGHVYSVNFSLDGKMLLSGSDDKTIKLWDLELGKLIKTLRGHDGPVWSVAFSFDGKTAVSGSTDRTLRCWDLESGKVLKILGGHNGKVHSVNFSPNGQTLVSGSSDHTLKLWDLKSGEVIHTLEGHEDIVRSVAYSPDGKYIISCSWDYSIRIWEQQTGKCIAAIPLLWRPEEIKPNPVKPGLYACANANGMVALFDFSDFMNSLL